MCQPLPTLGPFLIALIGESGVEVSVDHQVLGERGLYHFLIFYLEPQMPQFVMALRPSPMGHIALDLVAVSFVRYAIVADGDYDAIVQEVGASLGLR